MRCLISIILFLTVFQFSSAQKRPDGPFKDYYDTGELFMEGEYKNNKRTGEWIVYHKNGQINNISTFNDGKKEIPEISYFENGDIRRTIKKEGDIYVEREYYESGGLYFERAHKSGYYKEYREDGTLNVEANYRDYQLYGKWKSYDGDGKLNWSVSYEDGVRNGIYENFYPNGKVKVKGVILKDRKNGEEKRFNENGNLIWKGYYENDVFSKTWINYDDNGKKIKKINTNKEDLSIEPTEIPDGAIEKIAFHPACKEVFGNVNRRKCNSQTISRHIAENFQISKAENLGLKGRQKISVHFKIDIYGYVSIVKIKAPHPVLRIETQRVMQMLPKFEPGYQRGKAVAMPFTIPIVFEVK